MFSLRRWLGFVCLECAAVEKKVEDDATFGANILNFKPELRVGHFRHGSGCQGSSEVSEKMLSVEVLSLTYDKP